MTPVTTTIRTLNNGVQMPTVGLGVFLSPPEQTAESVRTAIDAGYRKIDTASAYLNEGAVGEGLRTSGVPRDQIFVTTKMFPTQYGYDSGLKAFDASLARLGLDYLDLYLLHWPVPADFDRTTAAYRAAEKLLSEGRVRAIGVSNFEPEHLDRLIKRTEIVPAVNQVELHPYFTQQSVRLANDRLEIATEAWSPIGGVFRRTADSAAPLDPLSDPVIAGIARSHGRTSAQVMLRWHLQNSVVVIPKSTNPDRIVENSRIHDFVLTADDMAQIDALDTGTRTGRDPETFDGSSYPADIDNQ